MLWTGEAVAPLLRRELLLSAWELRGLASPNGLVEAVDADSREAARGWPRLLLMEVRGGKTGYDGCGCWGGEA